MATIQELQKSIIQNCNHIYQKYAAMEVMDWDTFWQKTEPAMHKKYIDEDPSIVAFMQYRLRITFRDLMVVHGSEWPIKK